jgi:hypothetical protein
MHCAYISHTFLARNHLLASLLLSAGRRDAAVRVSCLRAEKNAWCFVIDTAHSTPILKGRQKKRKKNDVPTYLPFFEIF